MTQQALVVTLAVLLSGCTPFWHFKASQPGTDAPPAFCGISQSLATHTPARVLVVHGMGLHDRAYAANFEMDIASRLGVTGGSCTIRPRKVVNPRDRHGNYGVIDVCTFTAGSDSVAFYVWTWSSLTKPFKDAQVKYDVDHPDGFRLVGNKYLKKNVISLSLADAVLYAGRFKEHMRYGAEQALCIAMTDGGTDDRPCTFDEAAALPRHDFYIVTHSLGSMMVFDALRSRRGVAEAVGSRLKLFAMLANQWPLLELSTFEESREAIASNTAVAPSIVALSDMVGGRRAGESQLPIVAFTDPNDLLSFRIPDYWRAMVPEQVASRASFTNIVSSTTHGSILWLAANPARAHTSYWRDGTVLKKLTHGYRCAMRVP